MNEIDDIHEIESLMYDADVFRRECEFDKAISLYSNLLVKIKFNEKARTIHGALCLRQISYCYRKIGEMNIAIYYANEAVNLAEKNYINDKNKYNLRSLGICLMHLGSLYDELHNYSQAILFYKKGVIHLKSLVYIDNDMFPVLGNALEALGTSYFNNGDMTNATYVFNQLISLFKNNPKDLRVKNAYYYLDLIQKKED